MTTFRRRKKFAPCCFEDGECREIESGRRKADLECERLGGTPGYLNTPCSDLCCGKDLNYFELDDPNERVGSPELDNYENCKNRSVVKRKNCFEDCMDSSEDKRECYKACHCNHSIRMQQCIRKHRDEFENWREFCEEAKSSVCSTIPQCRGVNDPVYLERPCYCKCNCNDPDCPACEGTIFDIFS